jgi:hypothetical protein
MNHRRLRKGRHHGTQQTLRQTQQEGPLKLGEEGKKSWILEKMKLPTLKPLHPPTLGVAPPQPIHPQTNPLNMFRINGHGQG